MRTSRYTGRCSAMESAPAPCTLLYCSETDEPSEIEFQSPAITSWMIPHTDSSRYFYFTGSYEGEVISLFQLDLQNLRLCEQIDSTELAAPLTMPRFLQAYPDGCCYYIIQTAPFELADIRYFKRQHDRVYPVCAADPEQGDEYLDICREAPYLLMRRASAWEQSLYHEYTPAEIEMTDFGNAFDPVFRRSGRCIRARSPATGSLCSPCSPLCPMLRFTDSPALRISSWIGSRRSIQRTAIQVFRNS